MKISNFIAGWKKPKNVADAMIMLLIISILMLMLSLPVIAKDESERPSIELLEFLGEWKTEEGEWFNPMWILRNLSSGKDEKTEVSDDE